MTVGSLADRIEQCTNEAAGTLIFGGHQGLMMVSKYPIENRDFITPDTWAIQYGALYGEVQGVQIVCAHHAKAIFAPYQGQYDSYQG